MIGKLVSKGAKIDARNIIYTNVIKKFFIKIIEKKSRKFKNKNLTPLHYAAKFNSKEVFELLISMGANINAKDDNFQILIIIF